jgi:hypothetical protein
VFGCSRYHQYISDRGKIIVESDHKPLETIFGKSILDCPARLQRMGFFLQKYSINVRYRKGKEMYITDLLSRTATDQPKLCSLAEDEVYVYRIEQELEETTVIRDINETKMEKMRKFTKLDESLMEMKHYITEGWPIATNIEDAAMIYNRYRDELRFQEGVIWRFDRIVVPICNICK